MNRAKESEETEVKKDNQWAISELTKSMNFFKAAAKNGFSIEYFYGKELGTREAIQILEKLDEPEALSQELAVIPEFVAYVIEAYKSNSRLTNLLADLAFHGELAEFVEHEDEDEVFEWARSNRKATDEILARAWLDGYTVEEEQKYYVINKQGTFALRKDTGGVANSIYTKKEVERLGELQYYQLTEQEIKDYDPRYMTFAKPVKELEE